MPNSVLLHTQMISQMNWCANWDEIADLLASVDTTKWNGPDGISARRLKFTTYNIAPAVKNTQGTECLEKFLYYSYSYVFKSQIPWQL